MTTQQPEALAQECADYATSLLSAANVANLKGRAPSVSTVLPRYEPVEAAEG